MRLLYNAQIITMDSGNPIVSAILVDGESIRAVGDESLGDEVGLVEKRNMYGQTILPGLTDAHIHLENYALSLQKIDCETPTRLECLQRVAERAQTIPTDEWILGHGWNQNNWPEGFGSASDLDAAAPNHPVFLTAKSLHAAWANTAALKRAGLADSSLDPNGGRLGRDEKGHLNGILFESAMELVWNAVPEPSVAQVADAIYLAQPILWRMGLTGVHDFDRRRCFLALQRLHENNELKLRVIKSIPWDDLEHAIAIGLKTGFGDDYLRIGAVKAFSDGALGPQTAAMLQPYDGNPANRGMLLLDAEELYERGRLAVASGISMAVHAIGDRANHEVLDAFDRLRDFEGDQFFRGERQEAIQDGLRHRIEHVQVINPSDTDRLAQLGVVASMQPIHATSDMLMADRYWGERAALSYAWKTQLEAGARLAFGSDAPVESPNPFWGLHAAVTRQRIDGSPLIGGWRPEQRISVEDALRGFTTGAAYVGNVDKRQGKLAAGYLADLIVLNENPFTGDPSHLHELSPAATMVGGEWVFEAT